MCKNHGNLLTRRRHRVKCWPWVRIPGLLYFPHRPGLSVTTSLKGATVRESDRLLRWRSWLTRGQSAKSEGSNPSRRRNFFFSHGPFGPRSQRRSGVMMASYVLSHRLASVATTRPRAAPRRPRRLLAPARPLHLRSPAPPAQPRAACAAPRRPAPAAVPNGTPESSNAATNKSAPFCTPQQATNQSAGFCAVCSVR